jgi:hypothetical protein
MDQGNDFICDLVPWSGTHPLLVRHPPFASLVPTFPTLWPGSNPFVAPFLRFPKTPVARAAAANVNLQFHGYDVPLPPCPALSGTLVQYPSFVVPRSTLLVVPRNPCRPFEARAAAANVNT